MYSVRLNLKISKNTKDKLNVLKIGKNKTYKEIIENLIDKEFENFLIEKELNKDYDVLIDPVIKNLEKGVIDE